MKDKELKRIDNLWTLGMSVASAGFVITWAQPFLLPGPVPFGPVASLPFALLALWLQRRKRELSQHEPAPSTNPVTPPRGRNKVH
jgi:hypothetical protein